MKKCTKCKADKELDDFHKSSKTPDGRLWKCKACYSEYYKANRDRHIASGKEYVAANRDKRAAYYRAWCKSPVGKESRAREQAKNAAKRAVSVAAWAAKNRARKRATDAAWRAANKEHISQKNRRAALASPEKECAKAARYRSAKLRALPRWSDARAIEEIYAQAQRVSAETGVQYHVDHIVPLQGRSVCGLHVPCNLRVIPGSENMAKSNRFWPGMPAFTELRT